MDHLLQGVREVIADWFHQSWGNSPARWTLAITIAVVSFLVFRLARTLIERHLRHLVQRTKTPIDDLVLDLVHHIQWPFFLIAGTLLGSLVLELPEGVKVVLHKVFSIAFFIQGGLWVTHALTYGIDAYMRRSRPEDKSKLTVVALFNFFARLVVWAMVVVLTLDNLGVNVTTLVAGVSVGGIAVGLALQSVLKDLLASLAIILDKPFEVGDFVTIGEFQGTVEEIGLKTTRLRSISGEQLIFGNDDLLGSRVRNYKRMRERRVVFSFGVVPDTTVATLREISVLVRGIVAGIEGARFHRVHFKAFRDWALEFEVVYYVTTPDYDLMMDLQERINLALHEVFEQVGIRFATPTQTVVLSKANSGVE
jgi:small-conductance mechanosensitive channel